MKYYKLITASEPEFIGVNNGICQAELDKDNQLTGQLSDFFSGLHYWQRGKVVPDLK